LAAIAFADLSLRMVLLLNGEERRWKNHPFGLGKNVLGVLVQVQQKMVQIPESNGSIFSRGRLVRIHKK
jgi:hypothetical protein